MGRRGFTEDRRSRLIDEVSSRTDAGQSAPEIARALGISRSCVGRYRAIARERPSSELVRVVVEPEPHLDRDGPCALVTPDGFRFEGLDVSAAAELWRSLR